MSVKLLKRGERWYIELPESLKGKKLKVVKLSPEIMVVASEGALKEIMERQLMYMLRRGLRVKEERKVGGSEEYWVFSSEEAAGQFSKAHAAAIRRGELIGIKSFDGKYYVVRADVYAELLPKVLESLGEGASAEDVAKRLGKPVDLVKAVLELAREEGIVYEVRTGVYKKA